MPWNGCPKVFVTLCYQDLHIRLINDHFHISFTRCRPGPYILNQTAVAEGFVDE